MSVLNQVGQMTLLIIAGFICFKLKIITDEGKRCLSALVMKVANPVVILLSFQIEVNDEKLGGFLYTFLLSFIAIGLALVIAMLAVRGKNRDNVAIERFSVVYSNCGFMGIPLVNGIYGAEGVFYLSAFIAVFNIMIWTHGLLIIKGGFSPKALLSVLKSPAIIALALGALTLVFRIKLPEFATDTLGYIGDLNTPLAMLVAGAIIAETRFSVLLHKPKIYLVALLKLIVAPLAAILVFSLMPMSALPMDVAVTAIACPAAAMCTIFAITYKKDAIYAAELFAITTAFSILTLPLVTFALQWWAEIRAVPPPL